MKLSHKQIQWYTVGFALLFLGMAIGTSSQGVLLSDYIEYYRLESSAQGFMSAFQSAGILGSSALVLALSGRLRKPVMMLFAALALVAVFTVIGLKPHFAVLCGAYLFFGVSFGVFDAMASSVVADTDTGGNSSGRMNLLRAVYSLGGILSPLALGGLLRSGIAWHGVALVAAGFMAVLAGFYTLAARPVFRIPDSGGGIRVDLRQIAGYFKDRYNVQLSVGAFAYGLHQTGLIVWIPRFISVYQHEPDWGYAALSAYWIGATLSRLIATRLRISYSASFIAGNIIASSLILIGILAGSGSLTVVCVALAGFAEGTVVPNIMDAACTHNRENTAMASAVTLVTFNTGSLVAPALIAALIASVSAQVGMLVLVASGGTMAGIGIALYKSKIAGQ